MHIGVFVWYSVIELITTYLHCYSISIDHGHGHDHDDHGKDEEMKCEDSKCTEDHSHEVSMNLYHIVRFGFEYSYDTFFLHALYNCSINTNMSTSMSTNTNMNTSTSMNTNMRWVIV